MASVVTTMVQIHIAIPGLVPGEWQFLFLKRSPAETRYPNIWQVVTGGIEEGETAIEAAFREVGEETGLAPDRFWVLPYVGSFFDAERDEVHMVPAFGCVAPIRDVRLSEEHCECGWFSAEQAHVLLAMPSHREGTDVFLRSILRNSSPVFPSYAAKPV